jgi:hypothetical protein
MFKRNFGKDKYYWEENKLLVTRVANRRVYTARRVKQVVYASHACKIWSFHKN